MGSAVQEHMKISSTTIRRLRTDRGWSQEQLAVASGLSLRTIQRVESDGSASRETRTSLAATFGIGLTELGAEEKSLHQPVNQSHRSTVRYKITAGLSGVAFFVVILAAEGMVPGGAMWLATPSAVLATALAIYSGLGWYFRCGRSMQPNLRRYARTLFIFAAFFCAFASMRSNDSAQAVSMAAQIGGLSMLIYLALDFFISRHRRAAGMPDN